MQGAEGRHAFHIIEGVVEISALIKGERKVLTTRKRGEIVGELSVFSETPRTATVTARERTVVHWLTKELIEKELEKINPWISQMIRGLSNKFIELHERNLALGGVVEKEEGR